MALDIGEAIGNRQHLIVEAGVGIGKSFAYIVPLLLFHKQFRRPLIIATSTITLQEQLVGDIQRISDILNYPIQIVVAKGQTHYICHKHVDELHDSSFQDYVMKEMSSGCLERKDFFERITNDQWNTICISNYGKKKCRNCSYYEKCHFTLLRKEMRRTKQIVVCNQDLLTVHFNKINHWENGLLPEQAPIIVVDEAHNLEEKVRVSLTGKYNQNGIIKITETAANSANKSGTDIDKSISVIRKSLAAFFEILSTQILQQIKDNEEQIDTGRFFFKKTDETTNLINEVAGLLIDLDETIQIHMRNNLSEQQEIAIDELSRLAEDFQALGDVEANIVWMEKNTERAASLELCICPRNIPEKIKQLYFNGGHIAILTSATLTNQKSGSCNDMYGYLVKNIGFPQTGNEGECGYLAEPKLSPFSYEEHAMIYYATDLPHPTKSRDDFIRKGSNRIIDLLKLSNGRALILFTSKNDMNAVYKCMKESNLEYTLLKAYDGSSQEKILSKFRTEQTSVLLGTGAYWEGINIVGESLTNVIIFRLPFPVPDPIIKSKCDMVQNPLLEVLTPEMVVKLNQGVGRLIRSENDVGIISIIDPRLAEEHNAPYKNVVWDSLLIKNRTNDLSVLSDFYQRVISGKNSPPLPKPLFSMSS